MDKPVKVAICGVRGYSGQQLLNLVLKHPHLSLVVVVARNSQTELYAELPALAQAQAAIISTAELATQAIDVLFLATPADASMEIVNSIKDTDIKIIDLSGAFRLPSDEFQHWYGMAHQTPELLSAANYGLLPWAKPQASKLIANPGCYATCALMTLIPLLKDNIANADDIIIDAKSGVSGAGKKASAGLMFCEVAENFTPYKVDKHQHTPEINQALKLFSGKNCDVHFVTQLLPIIRGISMSIYLNAVDKTASDEEIASTIALSFNNAYETYPLVKCGQLNTGQTAQDNYLLSLSSVVGSAGVHISYYVKAGKITLFACIDNLLKGAASQAIENLNAIYQLPLETGLL